MQDTQLCVHPAKFSYISVNGRCFFATLHAQRHIAVLRCAVLGCLQLHVVLYRPFLRAISTRMVRYAVPQLGCSMGAYRALCARCARAVRKVGRSPPPGVQ